MNDHVDKEGRVCEVFSDTHSTWLGSLQEMNLNIVSVLWNLFHVSNFLEYGPQWRLDTYFLFSITFQKMSSQKAYRKMKKHRLSEYPPRFLLLSSELGDSVAHCLGATAPLSFTKESSSDTMCYNTGSQHLLDQREASSVLTCQGFVC